MSYNEKNITDAQIRGAIETIGPFYAQIAQALGSSRQNIFKRINNSAELKEAFDEQREATLDLAEGVVLAGIRSGDLKAATFALSTLGKARGYTRREEITGADGGPIGMSPIERRIMEMDDKELEAYGK